MKNSLSGVLLVHQWGLLDIFGFEKFEINGLEQLCINTANEQLAYFYNQRVFVWEQAELESEGLKSHKISVMITRKLLTSCLIHHKGLLLVLDEESKTAQATDEDL
ncbi:Myosin-IIIa [Desmophyllum pertusum]|uniref:Myosin-IIIa n=1 Tax=Desmophyllum pertusum TaxID=174260 RepID=A0A9W9YMM2_9CNID|nr:Myosin-IIIa [Desmophyllum pertusum]